MKIHAASDHAGVKLRRHLVEMLRRQGHEVIDLGPTDEAPCDYPDPAARVGRAVRDQPGTLGLLICGSGLGVAIAANKVRGVRAVVPWSLESARLAREHNDANVLCLGQRLTDAATAEALVTAWLDARFEGGRHQPRLDKIAALERAEAAGVSR